MSILLFVFMIAAIMALAWLFLTIEAGQILTISISMMSVGFLAGIALYLVWAYLRQLDRLNAMAKQVMPSYSSKVSSPKLSPAQALERYLHAQFTPLMQRKSEEVDTWLSASRPCSTQSAAMREYQRGSRAMFRLFHGDHVKVFHALETHRDDVSFFGAYVAHHAGDLSLHDASLIQRIMLLSTQTQLYDAMSEPLRSWLLDSGCLL